MLGRRRRRDEKAARDVAAFLRHEVALGRQALRIVNVYQRAARGSKAVVQVCGQDNVVDTWFWWYWAEPGSLVSVLPEVGWGPHTARSGVHYVGHEHAAVHSILGYVPSQDVIRADRHARRNTGRLC